MSADDAQASEWERLGAEVFVKHRPVPMFEGFRIASWTCQACYRNFGEYPDFAAHVMAEFREAGLAATERETATQPVWGKRQSPCRLVAHWADGDGESCTCQEITGWRHMELYCTPWREVPQ